ncbi:hypothetical protein BGZ80_004685 [Entomortierella chlamydospora]|uniref:Swiss Army Knife 2H phosphoesterase domain-containing protein n=1 Tax=Entomortierella chlamydospora TaxID=101097 RepID=A0A9P6MLS8_9FUNG|nr:hypothetical protein BGZ79_001664 [Entomortierella chlamydospora]KAG0007414.1 hypothetical protein BGZ80_004685 [Entomortierella chlamydospora]
MRIAASFIATLALVATSVMAATPHKKHHSKPHHDDVIVINKKVLDTEKVPYVNNTGNGTYLNWVGLNIDFKYVKPIFDLVNSTQSIANGTLISRGESHITVILPPEYDNILHPAGVNIDELNVLALKNNRLQRSKFEIECLGRVQVVSQPDGVYQQAVQIIIKNFDDIVAYRQEVFELFVKKGGNPALFDPANFTPHITVGFRHRDIFVEDGVFKGKNACIRKMIAK